MKWKFHFALFFYRSRVGLSLPKLTSSWHIPTGRQYIPDTIHHIPTENGECRISNWAQKVISQLCVGPWWMGWGMVWQWESATMGSEFKGSLCSCRRKVSWLRAAQATELGHGPAAKRSPWLVTAAKLQQFPDTNAKREFLCLITLQGGARLTSRGRCSTLSPLAQCPRCLQSQSLRVDTWNVPVA